MTSKVERIRGKKPWELYTPAGANKDGYSDRDDFELVVGNTAFHSFQVWRSTKDGQATCTYALTLKQLEAICQSRDGRMEKQAKKLEKLKTHDAEKLTGKNATLKAELEAANAHIADLEKLPAAMDTTPEQMRLASEVERLRTENRWLKAELRPVLSKQSNNAVGGLNWGSKSIRPISYPQGGDPRRKLGKKRR